MKQGYSIRILPSNSIVGEDITDKNVYKKYKQFGKCVPVKISGETFEDIPIQLPIRKKAAQFANCKGRYDNQTFAIVYADEKNIQCLFLVRYIKGTEDFIICRCVSKLAAKHHWDAVREYFYENQKGTIVWRASLEMQFFKI